MCNEITATAFILPFSLLILRIVDEATKMFSQFFQFFKIVLDLCINNFTQ